MAVDVARESEDPDSDFFYINDVTWTDEQMTR